MFHMKHAVMESLVLLVLVLGTVDADVNSNCVDWTAIINSEGITKHYDNVLVPHRSGGVTYYPLDYIAERILPFLESVPVFNTKGRYAAESVFLDYPVDEFIPFLGGFEDSYFVKVMTARFCVEYLQDLKVEDRKTLISLDDLHFKPGVTALEPNDLKENQKILDVLRGLAPEVRITLIKAFDTKRLANVLVAGGAKIYEDPLFPGIIKGVITVFGVNDFAVLRGLAPEVRITLIKAFDTKRLANVLVAGGAKIYEDHLFPGIIKGVITVFGVNDFAE